MLRDIWIVSQRTVFIHILFLGTQAAYGWVSLEIVPWAEIKNEFGDCLAHNQAQCMMCRGRWKNSFNVLDIHVADLNTISLNASKIVIIIFFKLYHIADLDSGCDLNYFQLYKSKNTGGPWHTTIIISLFITVVYHDDCKILQFLWKTFTDCSGC